MTDEPQVDDAGTESAATSAPGEEQQEEGQQKLNQTVEIRDVGPCKKHITVTINRDDIESRLNEKFKELVTGETAIPGFRPGKAPRKLIERRYQNEVTDQVKGELLLASLEQLAEEHELAPLAPPDLDPFKVALPKEGPLVYEFDIEVRPEFDLPDYRSLKLKRPVMTFTEEHVSRERRRLLAPYAQVIPKAEGKAENGDILVSDVVVRDGDRELNRLTEYAVRVDGRVAFKDGVANRFGEQVQGASAGESRQVEITLTAAVADASLRGKTVQATFDVKDVKTLRLPELTHEFLHNFGVHSVEQLDELLLTFLNRRLEHQQRQSAREQVIQQIGAATQWQLPEDLLMRQARRAFNRKVMEMRADGIPEEEILGRQRMLEQDVLRSTALALKEHFVLQKVAELEKIEVTDDDLEAEIDRIAEQNNESPRRVRARLEKEDLLEALAAEIVERMALDLILESAEYEDVPLDQEASTSVSSVEMQTVPGEMTDPTAPPPEEKAEGKAEAEGESPPAQS